MGKRYYVKGHYRKRKGNGGNEGEMILFILFLVAVIYVFILDDPLHIIS